MTSTHIADHTCGKNLISRIIATGFGSGYAPFASGTFGSVAGLSIWWLLCIVLDFFAVGSTFSLLIKIGLIVLTCAASIPAVNHLIEAHQDLDPKEVVVDEFLGMWITALFLTTASPLIVWIAAFFLFRVFDVLKPPPASNAENLPGAYGVITDDVIAGFMSLAVLQLALYFL